MGLIELRKKLRTLRNWSFRVIYPQVPGLHNFLFYRVRRLASRSYSLLRNNHGLAKSRLLFTDPVGLEETPLVSVIVPCFNHASFLNARLKSISNQTYKNIELILLDDCSTDGSREILAEFVKTYRGVVSLDLSTANSGSVFLQWQKGILRANGSLIWIAESDDSCDDHFLERLVPHFRNPAVMLAFANTVFTEANGDHYVWTLAEYLNHCGLNLRRSFTLTSNLLVNLIWSRKNIIPNASGCLFRAATDYSLFADELWKKLSVCADWIFYLNVARGGLVAYNPQTTNYYRQHKQNTSAAIRQHKSYIFEHIQVAQWLRQHFYLNDRASEALKAELRRRWRQNQFTAMDDELADQIGSLRPLSVAEGRNGNVLIVTYALVSGGGETFPLRLANGLHARGWNVTVVNCGLLPSQMEILPVLNPQVPLIQLKSLGQVRSIIHEFSIDIVHTHHDWADRTFCELLQAHSHVQHIVTTHGIYDSMDTIQLQQTGELLKDNVSLFTYVADKNKPALLSMGIEEKRLILIGNAAPTTPFTRLSRRELKVDDNAFVIALVSRAIVEKGWQIAIDAVAKVREACHVDVQLLLIGDGPEAARLQHQYQNTKGIHFLGLVPDSRPYFAIADLGLLPSFFSGESQPLTLIESLQAGCPYLASDIGEIRSMLSTASGLAGAVIPLQNGKADSLAFAEAIQTYIQTPELLAVQRNRCDEAAQKFSWDRMLNAYIDVYKKAHTSTPQP